MCKVFEDIRKDDQIRNEMRIDVLHIRDIMNEFGVTIDKAMDVIHIAQNMRSDVAYLVQSNMYP